jgi:hypothetical protein
LQPAFAIQIEPNAALKTRTRLVRRALFASPTTKA